MRRSRFVGVSATSRAGLWLPPLALMAVIYVLSDQPNLSSGLGLIDLVGRKLVYAAEYGLLCWLWIRAFRPSVGHAAALGLALLVTLGYAIGDEYHQTFVDGRSGSPLDVVIDALGAALAAAWAHRRAGIASSAARRVRR